MKKCIQCGNELNDNAQFCPSCGAKQPEKEQTLFCEQCGTKLNPGSRFCPSCGKERVNAQQAQQFNTYNQEYQSNNNGWTPRQKTNVPVVIVELSKREKMTAIMGIVMAGLQAIYALILFIATINLTSFVVFSYTIKFWIDFGALAAVSALNFVGSFKSIKFANRILVNQVGIEKYYISMQKYILPIIWNAVLLIYNIALGEEAVILGIIVMGYALLVSIIDIVYVRGFVMKNQDELQRLVQ